MSFLQAFSGKLLDGLKKQDITADDTIRELIDKLDDHIMDAITSSAEHILGSYTVNNKLCTTRPHPDDITEKIFTAKETVQIYKRMQRENRAEIHPRGNNVMQEVEDHFKAVFSQTVDNFRQPKQIPLHRNPELGEYYHPKPVYQRINTYSKTKSCGRDSIHTLLLTTLCSREDDQWTLLFSKFFECISYAGYTPKRWNIGLTFPIKKKVESKFVDEFRPIALTEMFRRWYEMGIAAYFNEYQSTKCLRNLSVLQTGFRKGQSTMTAVLLAHENAVNNPKLHTVLLDLLGAYDRTSISKLLDKLRRRGASEGLISIIAALFLNCSTYVVVNGVLTGIIQMERGLLQGSLLSPILFNIYIDDLLEALLEKCPQLIWPVALGYADDLILQHLKEAVMQELLNIAGDWNIRNGLCFNIEKCASLTPHKKAKFYLNDNDLIPYAESYNYLGFPLYRDGINWQEHVDNMSKNATNALINAKLATWNLPEYNKMIIYKTFIRPKMEYGAGLLSVMERKEEEDGKISLLPIEEVDMEAMRWIFGVGKYTSPMRAVTDIPRPRHRFFGLSVRLRQKLLDQSKESPLMHTYNSLIGKIQSNDSKLSVIIKLLKKPHIGYAEYKIPPANKPLDYVTDEQLKQYHLEMYRLPLDNGDPSTMAACIIPSARAKCKRGAGYDQVLRYPHPKTRKMTILWRINFAFDMKAKCPRCTEPFNRGHLSKCKVTSEILEGDVTVLAAHMNHKQSRINRVPESYNYLDAAMNAQKWTITNQVVETLQILFRKQYSELRLITQEKLIKMYSKPLPPPPT